MLLLAGCVTQGPVCNNPYIPVGKDCCLDKDDNGVCDKDEAGTPTSTTAAPTAASTSTTLTVPTTQATVPSTTTTSTTLPKIQAATSTTLPLSNASDTGILTVVEKQQITPNYAWYFYPPKVIGEDEWADVSIAVTTDSNTTFFFYLLNASQTQACREARYWFKCIDGVVDMPSVKKVNETFRIMRNWSITIKNTDLTGNFNIQWNFHNPSEKSKRIWDLMNTEYGGCLFYPNNGSTCELWDYRDCWALNLSVCKDRCCKLTRHKQGSSDYSWYRKCYSSTYLLEKMDVEYNIISNLKSEYYTWSPQNYKDYNCAEPYTALAKT
jgi:hypothetical protein